MSYNTIPVNGFPQIKALDELDDAIKKVASDVAAAGAYSTTETAVGKWGDDILYRKIVDIGTVNANSTVSIDSGLTNVTVRNMTICQNDTSAFRVFPWNVVVSDVNTPSFAAYYDYSNNKISTVNLSGTARAGFYAIIEYTKNPPTRDDDTEPETNTTKSAKRTTKKEV